LKKNNVDNQTIYQSISLSKYCMMKCFSPCIRLYKGLEIFIAMFLSCAIRENFFYFDEVISNESGSILLLNLNINVAYSMEVMSSSFKT